jgi:hypothetical protein
VANKKSLHFFWGIVLILLGAWFGFIVARVTFNLIRNPGGFPSPWLIGNLLLLITWSIFSVWVGSREFQRATGQKVKEPRFRWGRMLAGIYLVFGSLKSHFSPNPNDLKADNESQAVGMRIATLLMVLAGMLLVAYSFKPRKSQPLEEISQSNSDHTENVRVP